MSVALQRRTTNATHLVIVVIFCAALRTIAPLLATIIAITTSTIIRITMMLHAAAIRRPLEVLLLLGPTPPMALWMWAPDVLEDAGVESEEEEKEAPVDQVLPGNACSGLLFAPGSAVLLTHEKPPQVALPSRKAESPERPSRKVESPERPAAHDAACDALSICRRLRGKRPAQNVRQFLPAPGSGLLPPGAPRLPSQTPKLKKR